VNPVLGSPKVAKLLPQIQQTACEKWDCHLAKSIARRFPVSHSLPRQVLLFVKEGLPCQQKTAVPCRTATFLFSSY
jgi:hypothetical protein